MTRIVEVATTRLVRELHTPFVTALRRTGHVFSILVRVTAADGSVGIGEAPQIWRVTGESLPGIEACVLGPLADVLIGRDVDHETAPRLHRELGAAVAANTGARAACEVAVLDLLARTSTQTLAGLLGRAADSVATDITVAAQGAPGVADQAPVGFDRVKVKVGLDPADVARVIRIHRTDSAPVRVRIDANQAWDLDSATANVAALLRAGVALEFVEQPLPFWDLAGHAELRRRFETPIVLDESVFSVHDLHRAIAAESLDIVNIKLAKCGGAFAGVEIAEQASAAGLDVMVGSMMESEVGVSAAASLAAAIRPDQTHDLDAAWWSIDPLHDSGSPYRGGRFELHPSPGLDHASARVVDSTLEWQTRGPGPAARPA